MREDLRYTELRSAAGPRTRQQEGVKANTGRFRKWPRGHGEVCGQDGDSVRTALVPPGLGGIFTVMTDVSA